MEEETEMVVELEMEGEARKGQGGQEDQGDQLVVLVE